VESRTAVVETIVGQDAIKRDWIAALARDGINDRRVVAELAQRIRNSPNANERTALLSPDRSRVG
jgi:hypothetical protein